MRVALVSGAIAALALAPAAHADAIDDQAAKVTQEQIDGAISPIVASVSDIAIDEATSPIATSSSEGDAHTTTLQADVLFEFGSATLDERAKAAVESAVKDAPHGVDVTVDGYTDSVGDDAANQKLSEERAKAVGDVIRAKRSDLKPAEKGYGEADPVASNGSPGKDDPAGRAKNRRVEITYTS